MNQAVATDPQVAAEQKKIYDFLVGKGLVSAQIAASQSISESRDSIINDVLRVCSDDVSVAEAISKNLGLLFITELEEGINVVCGGPSDYWFYYSGRICLANPYDRRLASRATEWARSKDLPIQRMAVVPNSLLSKVRASHEGDTEDSKVDEKYALQIAEEIIKNAASMDVSDIHIQPTLGEKVDVLYRIDGVLRSQRKIDFKLHESMVRSIMEQKCSKPFVSGEQQDGKFDFEVSEGKLINLRVSTIPVAVRSERHTKMVMRLLGNNAKLASLDKIGLSPVDKQLMVKFGSQPNGMIILTGPTGSGKTTTLNALLLHMYSMEPNKNFHTIEDPVELQHQGMSHTEVSVTLSFAQALRAMLRQDPDVMLVGEMRDEETAELGYKAAMTGHLVLSTLHTNNAHESIGRLQRMGIDTEIIANNTTAFIAQRLCRAVCQSCALSYRLRDDPDRFALYGSHKAFAKHGGDSVIRRANPKGCSNCGGQTNAGEKGRRSIIEILEMTPDVQVAIISGENPAILRRRQIQKGTFTDLWDDGLRLVAEGAIGFEQLEKQLKPYLTDRVEVEETSPKSRGRSLSARAVSENTASRIDSL